jgi:hypothetical protein
MGDRVFISYRRSDSQAAVEHLMLRLADQFGTGQVYRDLDSNRAGFDFTKEIDAALDASVVVLVVIGPGWVTATDKDGRRRLDDPGDFTRREVEQALHDDKRVIPVLVDAAEMPKAEELPESLWPLARCHAVRLRSTDWGYDVERLIEHLERNGVRPTLNPEDEAGDAVKVHRNRKIYEREYSATRVHVYETLSATLQALHYTVIADHPERYELQFLWGNKEKAAGRSMAALYRRFEPEGVLVAVKGTRPGRAKIVIQNASFGDIVARVSGLSLYSGIVGTGVTRLERRVVQDFLDQVQRFLAGRDVNKDPVAVLSNLVARWTERHR